MTTDHQHDVLIIGSGAAGLSLALQLDERLKIAVISKRELEETNTYYAQGGISVVLDEADTIASHVKDTLDAGAGLCNEETVQLVVKNGPMNIEWLLKGGVNFTKDDTSSSSGGYHLTREGGHSHRRVIHAADATGKEVETTLQAQVMARPNIEVFEHHIAIDLITSERSEKKQQKRCYGAYILDHESSHVETFRARFVVLATGGASKVYLYTSNPDVSTGDGIAMAWRAGCRVANMEFIQFHPTCLHHPEAKSFLISEAVRGEGAHLTLPDGSRFMHLFDQRKELAPRDIVARAIDHEMKRIGADCLYLDISHKPANFIKAHFPTIYSRCLDFGIDMTQQPIPIVPAAHYTCGGVMADHQARTDITGLYVIGESAYTGLHGANRMASNSLLECLVFANLAAKDIHALDAETSEHPILPSWDESRVTEPDEEVVVSHNWDELRHFMWDYVGIVRSNKRLVRARRRVDLLQREIVEYYSNFRVSIDLLELRNLVDVADMIIRSAQCRRESRGLHFTIDFPYLDDRVQKKPTILIPEGYCPF
ncbi:MAG: L-aspartate oxidase [Candidatus Thiodiazotropha sp. (ex Lucinoma aequizonata)]|nr:L-aspartate oxidase [Candidatus Thiodiazotropha sp. (ex Lucinoma aequizonata)]MCU7887394.1 L-aspartate oxidase [Candidatus Thiodiazotropha sp. (ex Lucinoma aequizonata)]MCU7895868.1 L-aspartate oxidase [Candidatus Thiodiazotropha sp. (ex Lucinoma aequizonata)]MCU7900164.1 L-aspartate oxidase [Candidatus Thiodiazotropha sp. (ex Lucinoma aequizonata)]MCU7904154.1 L-aspartate oxidase [Candidatus Thiodiazotropha sp. (ex Lucinoma aequizonata)]